MKRKETLIYGALLVITLGAAWMVRHAEEPEEETGAVVFDPGAGGIQSMVWDDETSVATIEVSGKGEALQTWVTAGKKEAIETVVPAGDDDDSAGDDDDSAGDDDSAETTQPATKVVTTYGEPVLRQFPGNATARKLVESFSPLNALRTFSGLDAVALAEMGLDEPKGSLTVTAGGKSATFAIGEKSYGSSDTYVRLVGGDQVFLVASKDLSPLRGAENRLVERVLIDADDADITEAAITVDGAPAGSPRIHQGRHDKTNSFWASKDTPDDKDSGFGGFVEKVLQLRASSFPTDAEAPAAESVESLFAMSFQGEKGQLGTIELGRMPDEERSTGGETVYAWYARSDKTRDRWAVVSAASAGDLADLLPQVIE